MSDEKNGALMIFFLALGFIGGTVTTCSFKDERYRGEAVKHGCGSFELMDSTKSETEFRWKPAPVPGKAP